LVSALTRWLAAARAERVAAAVRRRAAARRRVAVPRLAAALRDARAAAVVPFELELVVRRVVAARRVLARRVAWRLPALRWVRGEVVFGAIGGCASCGLWASKGNKLTSKLPGI
jgi:hypothetical protein